MIVCVCVCVCVHVTEKSVSSYLSNDALHTGQWQALVVGLDDPLEQMVAQDFKHHADVFHSESSQAQMNMTNGFRTTLHP